MTSPGYRAARSPTTSGGAATTELTAADDPQHLRMPSEPAAVARAEPLITMPAAGARDPRPGLSGVAVERMDSWFSDQGLPSYRARQLADHMWSCAAQSEAELHTLPQTLRRDLASEFRVSTLADTEIRPADNGLTQKALHRLDDGRLIESVLMRYPARGWRRARATVCISSQAGCAVGLSVLRHRRARFRARPRGRGDRRPGALLAALAGRRRPAPDQRRLHGHGRAAAQHRARAGGGGGADGQRALRARRAPRDDQHQRRASRAWSA